MWLAACGKEPEPERDTRETHTEAADFELVGPWRLDSEKNDLVMFADSLDLFPGYGEWGAGMELRSDGQMSWYIGAEGWHGTYAVEESVIHAELTSDLEQSTKLWDFRVVTVYETAELEMDYQDMTIYWVYGGLVYFSGSRVKNPDAYLLDFDQMTGTDLHALELHEGDVLQIRFETVKGSLNMEIKAPDGTAIYRGNGKEITDFTVNIADNGTYTVVVEARHAKGTIHVQLLK